MALTIRYISVGNIDNRTLAAAERAHGDINAGSHRSSGASLRFVVTARQVWKHRGAVPGGSKFV
jgi:hypothetical protein